VQADTDAATARDHARFANDCLAWVVAEHPDRFGGFAALPTQDPIAGFERTTLSDADRDKIAHGNCERILRL
jgi:2,3-dihydroxybenzoate decarboxylase